MQKFDKDNDLLIVPDVHGRTFWRDPVMAEDYAHVIFLGDYVDPYPHERIYQEGALKEFCDIITFAKNHPEKVTLLLGNHDMHYFSPLFNDLAEGSRFAYEMLRPMQALYADYHQLFSLAFEAECEGIRCLFTHAGVSPVWLEEHKDLVGEPTAESLNALADNDDGIRALADVGWARGGWARSGGPMWADYSEVAVTETLPDVYQIFGHTQNIEREPVITRYVACLDCHRTFRLTEVLAASGALK